MIVHHREAVASAERLLERTERPELQGFLEAVIETQTAEIELMTDWIARRYPDAAVDVPYEPMMRDLEGAPVAEQEQAFLEDMIVHHMGAVRDAQALLSQGLAEHEDVADLARRIASEQRREMQQMRGWLVSWFDADPMTGMMQRLPADDAQDDEGDSAGGVDGRHRGPIGMGTMPGMRGMLPDADRRGMGMHGVHGRRAGAMPMGRQMGGMMPCPGPMGMGMPGMGMHGVGEGARMHDEAGYPLLAALARAFLAGEGVPDDEVEVGEVRATYEVVVRHGSVERVLIIDADTGRIRESTER
jgi:uncharacterized protein (DUF305 family)